MLSTYRGPGDQGTLVLSYAFYRFKITFIIGSKSLSLQVKNHCHYRLKITVIIGSKSLSLYAQNHCHYRFKIIVIIGSKLLSLQAQIQCHYRLKITVNYAGSVSGFYYRSAGGPQGNQQLAVFQNNAKYINFMSRPFQVKILRIFRTTNHFNNIQLVFQLLDVGGPPSGPS